MEGRRRLGDRGPIGPRRSSRSGPAPAANDSSSHAAIPTAQQATRKPSLAQACRSPGRRDRRVSVRGDGACAFIIGSAAGVPGSRCYANVITLAPKAVQAQGVVPSDRLPFACRTGTLRPWKRSRPVRADQAAAAVPESKRPAPGRGAGHSAPATRRRVTGQDGRGRLAVLHALLHRVHSRHARLELVAHDRLLVRRAGSRRP